MSKRKRKPKPDARVAGNPEADRRRPIHGWLLAGTSCLLVAQLLLPADGTTAADGAGVSLTMLWLLLVVVWLFTVVYRGRQPVRLGITDWAVLALVALHTISAVWAVGHAARPAINMLWEWISVGCCFLLVRQLVIGPRACRALMVIFVALATGLSAYSFYQARIEIPATRRAYEQDPDSRITEALGLDPAATVDPFAKQQFEFRLYTQRPTGTFLLANSLAGFLAPWLVVGFGVAWTTRSSTPRSTTVMVVAAACCLVIGCALYLTHSRTGWVAAVVGLGLILAWRIRTGDFSKRARVAMAFVALILVTTICAAVVRVDHPAAVAARRSVQYRLEYWQATCAMIAEHTVLGCGPGNFRDRYTAFKLPVALEEVADPHNFLLEVWATAGTPAMLALVAVFGSFFLNGRSRRSGDETIVEGSGDDPSADRYLLAGTLAGILLAAVMNPVYAAILNASLDLTAVVIIAGCAAASAAGMWAWVRSGRQAESFVPIAVAAMLVNLCAAGGIGNHGVAGSLWILVAIGLNLRGGAHQTWFPSRVQAAAAIILVLVAAMACQRTGYNPVIRSETALLAARTAAIRGDHAAELNKIQEAVAADPLAAGPPRRLTRLLFAHWVTEVDRDDPDAVQIQQKFEPEFRFASQVWLDRAPDSAAAHQEVGAMFLRAFHAGNDRLLLQAAKDNYQRAVARYPTSSGLRAHLAWTQALSGDKVAAAEEAARAIELDDNQPHEELRLDNDFQRISDPTVDQANTRILMEQLINDRSIDGRAATTIE